MILLHLRLVVMMTPHYLESEDKGWGKIVEMGADIIQTDWPLHLSCYLKKLNLR